MSRPFARFASLVLFAAATAGAGDAMAQLRGVLSDHGVPPERPQAGDRRAQSHDRRRDDGALADSIRRIERRTGGQVLSAERVPFDGRDVSRVKVVDASGRVRVYMDDGRSARPQEPRTRDDDD